MKINFEHALLEHQKAIQSVLDQSQKIEQVVHQIIKSIEGGGQSYLARQWRKCRRCTAHGG